MNRVHIKELQEAGYYVIHENKKLRIDINGELEEYPKGFFDSIINLSFKLI